MTIRSYFLFLIIALAACGQEETPAVDTITQIRELGQIGTAEFVVTKLVQANDKGEWYKIGDRKILMSVEATIKGGVDLGKISDEDVVIDGKSVTLKLPPAEIITFHMNSEKVKVIYAKSDYFRSGFSNKERDQLLVQGERQIRASLKQMGVETTAEENAIEFMESWLRLAGFEDIQIWTNR